MKEHLLGNAFHTLAPVEAPLRAARLVVRAGRILEEQRLIEGFPVLNVAHKVVRIGGACADGADNAGTQVGLGHSGPVGSPTTAVVDEPFALSDDAAVPVGELIPHAQDVIVPVARQRLVVGRQAERHARRYLRTRNARGEYRRGPVKSAARGIGASCRRRGRVKAAEYGGRHGVHRAAYGTATPSTPTLREGPACCRCGARPSA